MADDLRRNLDALAVLSQYGHTMLAVQLFELALAYLWLVACYDRSKPAGDLQAQVHEATKRLVEAHQKMTPGRVKHDLAGRVDRS